MSRETFENIYRACIAREGSEYLLDWLAGSDFYEAPASSRYHGAHAGGLVEHSLNVYEILKRRLESDERGVQYTCETVAIVALLHDLCKVNYYGQRSTGSYHVSEKCPIGDHADKSIFIIQNFMRLKECEIMAIRAHMGGWDHSARGGSNMVGAIFNRCRLAVHLHLADMEATYLAESREGMEEEEV